jgi:hypothetical protein
MAERQTAVVTGSLDEVALDDSDKVVSPNLRAAGGGFSRTGLANRRWNGDFTAGHRTAAVVQTRLETTPEFTNEPGHRPWRVRDRTDAIS